MMTLGIFRMKVMHRSSTRGILGLYLQMLHKKNFVLRIFFDRNLFQYINYEFVSHIQINDKKAKSEAVGAVVPPVPYYKTILLVR